jgi:hypothetical protein
VSRNSYSRASTRRYQKPAKVETKPLKSSCIKAERDAQRDVQAVCKALDEHGISLSRTPLRGGEEGSELWIFSRGEQVLLGYLPYCQRVEFLEAKPEQGKTHWDAVTLAIQSLLSPKEVRQSVRKDAKQVAEHRAVQESGVKKSRVEDSRKQFKKIKRVADGRGLVLRRSVVDKGGSDHWMFEAVGSGSRILNYWPATGRGQCPGERAVDVGDGWKALEFACIKNGVGAYRGRESFRSRTTA